MQYLLSVIDHETGSGTDAELEAIDAFNERLTRDGALVLAGGLAAPAASRVVDARAGLGGGSADESAHAGGPPAIVSEGPFAESTEYVAGLWIVRADDDEAALAIAAAASRACGRRVELRPFLPPPQG